MVKSALYAQGSRASRDTSQKERCVKSSVNIRSRFNIHVHVFHEHMNDVRTSDIHVHDKNLVICSIINILLPKTYSFFVNLINFI